MIGRRGLLGRSGAAALTLASVALASFALPLVAPPWHAARANRRITLLVGAAPGSAADRVARAFVPFLARQLAPTDIALRNLPGEAGLTGFRALADAPPSGNTIGWVATPVLPARLVDRDAGALLPRLRLLGAVQREPIVFVSPAATPLETVRDIVSRSSEDADAMPLGTPPPGSPPHLAALKLQMLAGTRLNIVTFPSAAAARQAALGGNLAAAALGMADVIDDLREGRLAGLGIAAEDRAGALPDLPALHEAGLPLAAAITRGIAAPADLPDDAAEHLVAALQNVVADPDFREQAEASGFQVAWIDGAAWTEQVAQERARLASLWATEPWLQSAGQ
ncbi:MAG: tripartite tricarboxylate transporter substrate-binding protein [Acetobacteraceae bacterium]|jgi:tripartite-type tricarboxylate transporter receptor subunit TctC